MNTTSQKLRNVTFFVLVAVFALLVALFSPAGRFIGAPVLVHIVLALGLVLLGMFLVVLTLRLSEPRIQKMFFLLTGAAAAAIPVCVILHNVVYGLFIWWFDEGFWARHGSDEPVFFIMAIIVCPALFLIGSMGSIVLLIAARAREQGRVG